MTISTKELTIRVTEDITVEGTLNVPASPRAFVIFSHGSGSSRFSTRNRFVAEVLNKDGFATLLTDLLTEGEDQVYRNRFDIELLTRRLVAVTNYATQLPALKDLPVGYFGASTGAASALRAAAQIPGLIRSVVSRGGRPDLAEDLLLKVKAPTLLIVGGLDTEVIYLNRKAYLSLGCLKDLRIVEGASHLFGEPGKLDEVAVLAAEWFDKYLIYDSIIKK